MQRMDSRSSTARWFETRGLAALLTMRVLRPYPEERALARVSKDEATGLENALAKSEGRARSRFGLTLPVFSRAFRGRDSPLDKIYFH
jgi:hypothetical protein